MKQPHTEQTIDHTDDQQNTGNHKKPGVAGPDQTGGTRTGAANVEGPAHDSRAESVETGTDVDKVSGLDQPGTSTKSGDNPRERHPERDEHGRL